MKAITSLICFFFILLINESILGQCAADYSTILSAPNLRMWNLAYTSTYFFDDFSGGTLSSTWSVKTGTVRNCGEEAQHYKDSPNNIDLSSGSTLRLIARRETSSDWIKCSSPIYLETKNYTSGDIETFDHTFLYGIYEIRAKYPIGNGAWAAFWHYGDYPPCSFGYIEQHCFEAARVDL